MKVNSSPRILASIISSKKSTLPVIMLQQNEYLDYVREAIELAQAECGCALDFNLVTCKNVENFSDCLDSLPNHKLGANGGILFLESADKANAIVRDQVDQMCEQRYLRFGESRYELPDNWTLIVGCDIVSGNVFSHRVLDRSMLIGP